MLHMFQKYDTQHIGFGLNVTELACKCTNKDCTITLVDHTLITQWTILRTLWNKPIRINSGFRCQKHNEAVGGIKNSKHMLGHALDLDTANLSKENKKKLFELCQNCFHYVHEYPTFIHVHLEPMYD